MPVSVLMPAPLPVTHTGGDLKVQGSVKSTNARGLKVHGHRRPKVEYILQRKKYTCSSKINVRFGFSALENLISRGTLARSEAHVLRKVLRSPGGGGVKKLKGYSN